MSDIEKETSELDGPRVTFADIEANIKSVHYFTAAEAVDMQFESAFDVPEELELLTFCVLIMRNGFTVTGESACASPENFRAELGKSLAYDDAVHKVWPLMGYELKTLIDTVGK